MISKPIGSIVGTAVAIGLVVVIPMALPAQTPAPEQTQSANVSQAGDVSHLIWVRILPFGLRDLGWQLPDHNGQDILNMIQELKPDVLERFITGKPTPNAEVPMGPGVAPMKFVDYLDAAMKAEAPGGFLTPKVHLNDIWTDEYRLEAAQALHDLPVTPRMKLLSLDEYFSHGTADDRQRILEKFKAMGWQGLGFNFAGGPKDVFGLGTYAMAGVNRKTWDVNQNALAAMKDEGIPIRLAHIDYPQAIDEFKKLTPDQQADVIQKLSQEQHRYGFTFVYPVLYGRQGYDASREVTRADGPYKGATVLQVIKEDIRCDRQYPAPCTPQFKGQTAAGAGGAPK